jgi:hypothetical protein
MWGMGRIPKADNGRSSGILTGGHQTVTVRFHFLK